MQLSLARERLSAERASRTAAARSWSAIVDYALAEPEAFSFLTYEAGSPVPMRSRDATASGSAGGSPPTPCTRGTRQRADPFLVPAWVLLGGLLRLLGIRMRRGEHASQRLAASSRRGSTATASGGEATSKLLAPGQRMDVRRPSKPLGPAPPQPLPRGRHRLPGEVVRRVQRERILHATARVISAKGYPNTTVADIVASAGVSREVFYSHFSSRAEAFLQTHQLVFEQLMATTAGAFFATAGPWTEQVWQSAQASTRFVLEAPSLAYFAFVESYALGSSIAPRTDEAVRRLYGAAGEGLFDAARVRGAAPLHLRGDRRRDDGGCRVLPSPTRRQDELTELLPMTTYLVVTPFVGRRRAASFIRSKLRERAADVG